MHITEVGITAFFAVVIAGIVGIGKVLDYVNKSILPPLAAMQSTIDNMKDRQDRHGAAISTLQLATPAQGQQVNINAPQEVAPGLAQSAADAVSSPAATVDTSGAVTDSEPMPDAINPDNRPVSQE